jgi:hypothetical protein
MVVPGIDGAGLQRGKDLAACHLHRGSAGTFQYLATETGNPHL